MFLAMRLETEKNKNMLSLVQEGEMGLGTNTLLCQPRLSLDRLKKVVSRKLKASPICGCGHV